MDFMPAGTECLCAHTDPLMGKPGLGDAEDAPRHPASRGAGIAKGQHCDSRSSSWVGLVALLFVLFPSTLLFTVVFSLI